MSYLEDFLFYNKWSKASLQKMNQAKGSRKKDGNNSSQDKFD